MIHRRNIAVAYALAIPIFLVALFVELGTLYKLNAAEGDVVKAMSASNGFDDLLAELREAEKAAQGYVASGSDDYRLAYGKAAGQVNGALDRLEEQTKDDPQVQSSKAQANLRQLRGATAERLQALERAMSARSTRPAARANASEEMRESDAEAAIGKIVAELGGDERTQSGGRAGQRRAQRGERQYAGEVRGRADDLDDRGGRAAAVSRRPGELSRANRTTAALGYSGIVAAGRVPGKRIGGDSIRESRGGEQLRLQTRRTGGAQCRGAARIERGRKRFARCGNPGADVRP